MLAKAKTGTGKTLGFLIPAVELLTRMPQSGGSLAVLCLAPTRELAIQINKEGKQLLQFHPFDIQVVVGGKPIGKDQNMLNRDRCDILVATPGRLIDHLDNTQGFKQRLQRVGIVIFDEADQMLDMGFRPAIERILRDLPPKENRQTLLFSATVPKALLDIRRTALRPNSVFVDTVGEEAEQTHSHVHQEILVVPFNRTMLAVFELLDAATRAPNHKIIVFFTTARVTGFMAEVWMAMGRSCVEIHSRKSQPAREKASAQFKAANNMVMFTSDVTARGMDYPNVTLVLQVLIHSQNLRYHSKAPPSELMSPYTHTPIPPRSPTSTL